MGDLIAGLKLFGIDISATVAQKQHFFLTELLRWSKQVNLTSIRTLEEGIEKHLIDSLVLLPHLYNSDSLLDIGSGGGLPGIPLALAMPELQVTSVDSVGKKINFQKHIKRTLQVDNLQPLHTRIDALNELIGADCRFNAVVSRAFSSLDAICACASPWLERSGLLLVMKGAEGLAEYTSAERQILASGLFLESCRTYQLPFSGAKRQLLILKQRPA